MATAFSASLFGLAGSLVLGFLDLQAGQAQNRFYNDLEEWLSTYTRLSSGPFGDGGDGSVPAYLHALLEQTADSLENLQRIVARSEESRISTNTSLSALTDRLGVVGENMQAGPVADGAACRKPDGTEAVADAGSPRSPRTRSARTMCCAPTCATSRPIWRG